MRLAVCVMNEEDRRLLALSVGQQLLTKGVPFLLEEFRCFRELLYEIEDGRGYEAVILDANDAQAVEQDVVALRAAGFVGKIVLAANDASCAVHGYDWGIDGFWTLPVDAVKAATQLEKLLGSFRKACLTVRCRSAWHHVPFAKIVCIESCNNKCRIHRIDGEELTVYARLDTLELQLTDPRFLRCHQSFLINMDHVVSIDKQFELQGGISAAVRQRSLKSVREQYLSYIRAHLSEDPSLLIKK